MVLILLMFFTDVSVQKIDVIPLCFLYTNTDELNYKFSFIKIMTIFYKEHRIWLTQKLSLC